MHPNKPYWTAVFVSVRCFKDFLSPIPPDCTQHPPPILCMLPPPGRHRIYPPLVTRLLYPFSSTPDASKRVRQFQNVKTFKHDSREFLDKANAFYLTVPSRLGALKAQIFWNNLSRFNKSNQLSVQQLANVFTNPGACFSQLASC